jgi:hypothetical protein
VSSMLDSGLVDRRSIVLDFSCRSCGVCLEHRRASHSKIKVSPISEIMRVSRLYKQPRKHTWTSPSSSQPHRPSHYSRHSPSHSFASSAHSTFVTYPPTYLTTSPLYHPSTQHHALPRHRHPLLLLRGSRHPPRLWMGFRPLQVRQPQGPTGSRSPADPCRHLQQPKH